MAIENIRSLDRLCFVVYVLSRFFTLSSLSLINEWNCDFILSIKPTEQLTSNFHVAFFLNLFHLQIAYNVQRLERLTNKQKSKRIYTRCISLSLRNKLIRYQSLFGDSVYC